MQSGFFKGIKGCLFPFWFYAWCCSLPCPRPFVLTHGACSFRVIFLVRPLCRSISVVHTVLLTCPESWSPRQPSDACSLPAVLLALSAAFLPTPELGLCNSKVMPLQVQQSNECSCPCKLEQTNLAIIHAWKTHISLLMRNSRHAFSLHLRLQVLQCIVQK